MEVSIGTRIKALRLQAGLTQVQVAQAAGLLQGTFTRYETNKKIPSAPRLAAIARALGTTVEEILDDTLPPPAAEARPHLHGNSTAAQIQKLVQELDSETQGLVLKQVKLMLPTSKEKKRTKEAPTERQLSSDHNDHKRRPKAA